MIKAVIFDFGGVLAQPRWNANMIVNHVRDFLKSRNILLPDNFAEILDSVIGEKFRTVNCNLKEVPFEVTIKEACERAGIEIDDKTAYEVMLFLSNAPFHELIPESERVLRELKEMSLKIGVLSNTAFFIPRKMINKSSLRKYIDAIVLSREVGLRKPHPAIYWEILRKLEVKPEESIFVGDVLEIDIYGAKRVGMIGVLMGKPEPVYKRYKVDFTCLKIPKELKPDYRINNLEEVVRIIKTLGINKTT